MLVVFAALPTSAAAQDAHYWGFENGARATLLGGAVVAGTDDLSASYYQPASLGRAESGTALTMAVKTVTDLDLEFGGTNGFVARSSIGASAPGFFAARLPLHIVDGDVLAFSFVARKSSKLDLSGGFEGTSPSGAQGADLFIFQDIYDGWYGLSWALDSRTVSVGASVFLSNVSYRQRIQYSSSLLAIGTGFDIDDDLDFSFAVRRMTAKVGATWTGGPLTLGVTVSPPSVRLPGASGELSVGSSLVSPDAAVAPELAQHRETGLEADYRKPLSFAWGAELAAGPLDLVASAEWFGEVDPYEVLETTSFTGQTPATVYEVPLLQSRSSVLNTAAGLSWAVAGPVSLFASARTDRSYRDPDGESFVGLNAFDITHATVGVGIVPTSVQVWFGVIHAWGEGDQAYTVSALRDEDPLTAGTRFSRVGFALAFSAAF